MKASKKLTLLKGGGMPGTPPVGFVWLVDSDGIYLVDADGYYLLEAV